jgi:hypothetical protein
MNTGRSLSSGRLEAEPVGRKKAGRNGTTKSREFSRLGHQAATVTQRFLPAMTHFADDASTSPR